MRDKLALLLLWMMLFTPRGMATEVMVKDYPWLWQDLWQQSDLEPYRLLAMPVRILLPEDVAFLVAIGDQLSVLRKEGKLSLSSGMWQENLLVNQLNYLLLSSESELATLASEFDQNRWSSRSKEFMALMALPLQEHFGWDLQMIRSNEDLEEHLAMIDWPTSWLSRSFDTLADMQQAMQHQVAWQALLSQEHEALSQFFADSMQEMFMSMSANILYYWLYTPDTPWPIYSRNDAIRLIYTFYVGFYEVLDLLSIHYWHSYDAYLSSLTWQGEELDAYRDLLADNWKSLMALFYDASSEANYVRIRNQRIFKKNPNQLYTYQKLLLEGYAWFLASDEAKQEAIALYNGEIWADDQIEQADQVTKKEEEILSDSPADGETSESDL